MGLRHCSRILLLKYIHAFSFGLFEGTSEKAYRSRYPPLCLIKNQNSYLINRVVKCLTLVLCLDFANEREESFLRPFFFFHKAIIIDKKQSNTCETVERVKKIGSEGGSREGRFSWEKRSP